MKTQLASEGLVKDVRYVAAFYDLNNDGVPEAVVHVEGQIWCGSGGCTTFVLKQEKSSWTVVTKIGITRPPIRVLNAVTGGWHELGVFVQGGGIRPGYEAELKFDGQSYPSNPSVPPSVRAKRSAAGEVLIDTTMAATPLFGPETR